MTEPARKLFDKLAGEQAIFHGLPKPTTAMKLQLEKVFAGNLGATQLVLVNKICL